MKRVMSSDMVAHTWAHQSQSDARNSGDSVSFADTVIYSYRTPIAKIHTARNGGRVALITSAKYSATTSSKHMPAVHKAVRGLMPAFVVPAIGTSGGRHREPGNGSPGAMHAANVAYLGAQYTETAARMRRARDVWSFDALTERAAMYREYCEAFGFDIPRTMREEMVSDHIGELQRYRADREERLNTPEAKAKRERAAEQRAARKEAKEAAERAERLKTQAQRVAEWRAGMIGPRYGLFTYDVPCMLRMHPVRGDMVETSLGAEVPEAHARKVYRFAMAVRHGAGVWQRGQDDSRAESTLGRFRLDSISLEGIGAGCHRISWQEIDAFAAARAWEV